MNGSEGTPKLRRLAIGLDCASSTGIAIVDVDTEEVVQIGRFKCNDPVPGRRYKKFINGIMDEIKRLSFVTLPEPQDGIFVGLGVEMPHHRGRAATEYAYGYLAFAEYLASHDAFDQSRVVRVHTGTLKKFATGSGKADKTEMVKSADALLSKYGFEKITSDDIADALWVALYTAHKIKLAERAEEAKG